MTDRMTDEENILKKELAKLGAAGGAVGGLAAGVFGSIGGAAGGAAGAAWAQQFLPTERYTKTLRAGLDGESVLNAAFKGIRRVGRIAEDGEEEPAHPALASIIKAGFLNMNPAVVYFELLETSEKETTVRVTAYAKEGLIKQKTAQKAAGRLLDAMSSDVGRLEVVE